MNIVTLDGVIRDRGSKYAVSGGVVADKAGAKGFLAELKRKKKFAKATHNSWAVVLGNGQVLKNDDGESGAGALIARLLEQAEVTGVIIVVTRWYGGTKLGSDRFRHVRDATLVFLADWAKRR